MASDPYTTEPVQIIEVAPRDGLQNEPKILSAEEKVRLIEHLVAAGHRRIEAVSFANPRIVPQMADAEEVMRRVPRGGAVSYAGLILNHRGLDRAIECHVDEINFVVCASDTFSRRNQNVPTRVALEQLGQVADTATEAGIHVTATIANAFGCPYEGKVPLARVKGLAQHITQMSVDELCLADTTGVGVPDQVRRTLDAIQGTVRNLPLRLHLHNTRNSGYANAYAGLLAGVRRFDSSLGGIGGCPFAPHATGNIATEDLYYVLGNHRPAGLSLEALVQASNPLAIRLGHPLPAMAGRWLTSSPRPEIRRAGSPATSCEGRDQWQGVYGL